MKFAEIRLGEATLDPETTRLTGPDGQELSLRHKSRQVLCALARHPHQTVSKDALCAEVWPATAVSDESLVQCIADIRRALGDGGKTLVETVPREGYRLNPAPPPGAARRARLLLPAGLAAAALAGLIAWTAAPPPAGARLPVLAVLPLDDLSHGDHADYLNDALSEGMITELARFPQFQVIARHSSFQFRDTASDIRDIAETLGADYIVEGSQQFDGARLRVTVQLIDARTGTHVFADRIDGSLDDVFEVQDRIVRHVASTVGGEILNHMPESRSGSELDSLLRGLKARRLMSHYSRENWEQALALEQTSLRLDPDSPWGWIGTALMLRNGASAGWTDTPAAEALAQASDLADQALMLDPDNYMSHYAKARVLATQNRYTDSLRHFERAAELNPSDSLVLIGMSDPLIYLGQTGRAIEVLTRARSVDPLHGDWLLWQLGQALWLEDDCDRGIAEMRAMTRPPPASFKMLSGLYACAGDTENARAAMQTFLAGTPGFTLADETRVFQPWTDDTDTARWLTQMRLAGMPEAPDAPAAVRP